MPAGKYGIAMIMETDIFSFNTASGCLFRLKKFQFDSNFQK